VTHTAPTGTVTIVFSDVPDERALKEAAPEAWKNARASLDALFAKQLRSHIGYAGTAHGVDIHVFHEPGDALHWCLDIQRLLLQVTWPPKLLEQAAAAIDKPLWKGLRVRMALHAGGAKIRADLKRSRFRYFGDDLEPGLHALRLAHAGQIILTAPAWTRVRPYVGDTLVSALLGRFHVAGEPMILVQIAPEDLAAREFLPVAAPRLPMPDPGELDRASLGYALANLAVQTEEGEA